MHQSFVLIAGQEGEEGRKREMEGEERERRKKRRAKWAVIVCKGSQSTLNKNPDLLTLWGQPPLPSATHSVCNTMRQSWFISLAAVNTVLLEMFLLPAIENAHTAPQARETLLDSWDAKVGFSQLKTRKNGV